MASLVAPAALTAPAPAPEASTRVIAGFLERGQTLSSALNKGGASRAMVDRIAREFRPVYDFRYSHAGDEYSLIQSADGALQEFHYTTKVGERYRLTRAGERYVAERFEEELLRRQSRIAGVVSSSLYDAVQALGENPQLAHDFSQIFAWDVDFSRTVQPGDEFGMVYERLYRQNSATGAEEYVRPGRILAAHYKGSAGNHSAIYFESEEGQGSYYRLDGSSVQRQFLAAPLNYSRISSSYSLGRLHPILRRVRPHLGIDYAAPSGTPVWSISDGTVIFRGWSGGLGRLVKVRHSNGYVSYYGHLSRFPDHLRVGSRVQQKQVVGYVGSSGLATGPHLHFCVSQNGRMLNPASLGRPMGNPIPSELRAEFTEVRDSLLADLNPPDLVGVQEAL